jgi:hypothetical protein
MPSLPQNIKGSIVNPWNKAQTTSKSTEKPNVQRGRNGEALAGTMIQAHSALGNYKNQNAGVNLINTNEMPRQDSRKSQWSNSAAGNRRRNITESPDIFRNVANQSLIHKSNNVIGKQGTPVR